MLRINFHLKGNLDIMKIEYRIPITRMRLSNHNFPIEKLRYQKVERDKRKCQICDKNEIGNEIRI